MFYFITISAALKEISTSRTLISDLGLHRYYRVGKITSKFRKREVIFVTIKDLDTDNVLNVTIICFLLACDTMKY